MGTLFLTKEARIYNGGSASPRGPRRSSRLNLPRSPIFGRLSHLDLPRDPILRRPSCLDLPRDLIFRRLSCLSLPEDLHADLATPGSQVATVLGRISFRKTHP